MNVLKLGLVGQLAAAMVFASMGPEPALAVQSGTIDAKTVPLMVFRRLCLASHGDNDALVSNLKQMKADHPKLLAEMSAKHRAQLLGDDRPIGWVFTPAEAGKAFWLGASSKGMCEVNLYGSAEQLKEQFESELRQHATQHSGKFYFSGDASFLADKSKTGFSYTLEMPKGTAYVMLVQSAENADGIGHQIQLMTFFKAKG